MRSKSPLRTAGSLKLGHTMTFAWHFCFWACFCFPCCLECLPLFSHDPNPANPSKLRLNPSLMNAARAALGSLHPAGALFVPHSLHFLVQSSIYRSLVLNCFICITFTFSENLSALYAFYFFWVLTVFHAISRHRRSHEFLSDVIICIRAWMLKKFCYQYWLKWRNITGTIKEK